MKIRAAYRCAYVVLCSAAMSVFFVTTLFLADIISWKNDKAALAYGIFMVVLYGVMVSGSRIAEYFIKWAISLPLSYFVINYFWKTNYAVRSLNWMFPGYGKMSAGGGFALGVMTVGFVIACLVSMGIAFFLSAASLGVKTEKIAVFEKIQLCVGCLLSVFIIALTVTLERKFPSYESIFFAG